MKFSKGTSYNTHDAKADVTASRIYVTFNVRKRCDLVMRAALRYGAEGTSLDELTAHINKRLNCLYSETDIRYAAGRLVKDGFLVSPKRNHFVASSKSLEAWKKAPKEWI